VKKVHWLNSTVLGIGLASLFSDWSHEIATAALPAFLATLGVAAAWLGVIEGVSDGVFATSQTDCGHGLSRDCLRHRRFWIGDKRVACVTGASERMVWTWCAYAG